MNWLDLFGDSQGDTVQFSEPNFYDLEGRCEDDTSVVAPFIGLCPEETNKEELSPLNFGTSDTVRAERKKRWQDRA